MYTFKVITFGCKVNQYESAYIGEKLKDEKWAEAAAGQPADIYIVNTCIVTERAAFQSRQAVRRAIRENPRAKIAFIGCYVQVYEEELRGLPGIHLLAGNLAKSEVVGAITRLMHEAQNVCQVPAFSNKAAFEQMPIRGFSDHTRAFLKIQDGCESYCSYCIVPRARGPLRSLEPEKVLDRLQTLAGQGYLEVVLTGIHLGKYGHDLEGRCTLAGLLQRVGAEKFPLRIRLSSLEPQEIHDDLIAMLAEEKWLCRHFHIPLQSGDEQILKKMNRHYTPREFAELIQRIQAKISQGCIGVDVMVGFPGETEHCFQNTMTLIRELPVSYLHVFPFSKRKGTPAAQFPEQVDPPTMKQRAEKIRKIGLEKRKTFYRSCLGKEFQVLAEGWQAKSKTMIKGWSDNYLSTVFRSDSLIHNRLVKVVAEDLKGDVLVGTIKE